MSGALTTFAALATGTAVLAVAVFVLTVVAVRQGAKLRALTRQVGDQAQELSRLNGDLGALLECSRTIGSRLGASERSQREMKKRIEQVQLDDTNQVAIQHAMKLLDNGWEMTEVKEICDLTHGEIEILQSLRQHKAA